MTYLSVVLAIKVIVSIVIVAIPFLFLPKEKLEKAMSLEAKNTTMFRLYGVATLALIVAYSYGIVHVESGVFPWGVTLMGMVSNLGATVVLLTTGAAAKQTITTAFLQQSVYS